MSSESKRSSAVVGDQVGQRGAGIWFSSYPALCNSLPILRNASVWVSGAWGLTFMSPMLSSGNEWEAQTEKRDLTF